MNEDLIKMILALGFLLALYLFARKRRNDRFSKRCPKCGCNNVHPIRQTSLRFYFDYKCPQCGHKWGQDA